MVAEALRGAAYLNPNPAMVELLLDRGGDLNVHPSDVNASLTAWALALLFNPNPAITELMLDRGADLNVSGYTSLHFAVSNPNPAVAAVLIDRGADIEEANNPDQLTPLQFAVWRGNTPGMVKLLLDRGADPDAHTRTSRHLGRTSLHFAVLLNKPEMVEALLDAGADAKIQDDAGDTPCRVARDEGHFADTPLLIRLCRP